MTRIVYTVVCITWYIPGIIPTDRTIVAPPPVPCSSYRYLYLVPGYNVPWAVPGLGNNVDTDVPSAGPPSMATSRASVRAALRRHLLRNSLLTTAAQLAQRRAVLRKLLSKEPMSRTLEELQEIAEWAQHIRFSDPHMHSQINLQALCRALRLQPVTAGEVIMTQGEVGDSSYIVFEGQATVYVASEPGADRFTTRDRSSVTAQAAVVKGSKIRWQDATVQNLVRRRLSRIRYQEAAATGTTELDAGTDGDGLGRSTQSNGVVAKDEIDNLQPQFVVKPLFAACEFDAFGELSLIFGLPRSATIVAERATSLLRIGANDFETLIKEPALAAVRGRADFLRRLPSFQGHHSQHMINVASYFKRISCESGATIGPTDGMLLIVERGEVHVCGKAMASSLPPRRVLTLGPGCTVGALVVPEWAASKLMPQLIASSSCSVLTISREVADLRAGRAVLSSLALHELDAWRARLNQPGLLRASFAPSHAGMRSHRRGSAHPEEPSLLQSKVEAWLDAARPKLASEAAKNNPGMPNGTRGTLWNTEILGNTDEGRPVVPGRRPFSVIRQHGACPRLISRTGSAIASDHPLPVLPPHTPRDEGRATPLPLDAAVLEEVGATLHRWKQESAEPMSVFDSHIIMPRCPADVMRTNPVAPETCMVESTGVSADVSLFNRQIAAEFYVAPAQHKSLGGISARQSSPSRSPLLSSPTRPRAVRAHNSLLAAIQCVPSSASIQCAVGPRKDVSRSRLDALRRGHLVPALQRAEQDDMQRDVHSGQPLGIRSSRVFAPDRMGSFRHKASAGLLIDPEELEVASAIHTQCGSTDSKAAAKSRALPLRTPAKRAYGPLFNHATAASHHRRLMPGMAFTSFSVGRLMGAE